MNQTVDSHGQLKVLGNQIVDMNNKPFQLNGISSHGLQWFGNIVTREALLDLRDNWNIKVFRAAMYTVQGGYIENRSVKNKLTEIVDTAIELGLYIIIDWHILHDNNPQMHQKEAVEFFSEMAIRYGNFPNIIYELCNEPNGSISWGGNIKPYALSVIKEIRKHDTRNLILVGSGSWSQNLQDPANDPIPYQNVAYTLHFYAGTHGQSLRDRISYAMGKGIAIHVSEWGLTDSSGNGSLNEKAANDWLTFLDEKKIGYVNWSYSNASESSAALTWDKKLTRSGQWVKTWLTK